MMTAILLGALLAPGCGGKKDSAEDTGPKVSTPPSELTRGPAAKAADAAGEAEDPRFERYRAARARLTAGRKAFDEKKYPQAMVEAQRGIDVLGDGYAAPDTADDTDLKVAAAKERERAGDTKTGAQIMLRMLAERVELARRYWKPPAPAGIELR